MAFILADRVKESCNAPGTSTVTLLGAATGYQSFSAGIGANNTTYYVIADQGGANWEVGLGTIGAGGTTLARTTVLSSSNSGSLVNFASGTQDVWCDYPAGKAIIKDANGNTSWSNEAPGYTNYVTSGQTISLTASATYYQHFSGSSTATLKLPDETTIPVGLAYIIDNDSSANVTVQDSGGNLLTTVTSGMAGYIYSLSNSAATGNWAGYIFPPGNNATGTPITWGTSGLNMAGTGIDNAVIGATTPNTGTFTTITGQTEVLKGTGNNLLTYSNTFTNAVWTNSSATITTGQSDPFSGSTASLITASATGGVGLSENPSGLIGTYTFSVYAKAGTSTYLRLFGGSSAFAAWFNLSTGAVGTVQAGIISTSIVSAGSGWYRCSITINGGGAWGIRLADADNNTSATSGTTQYIYGAQLEIGSVTNTYVPTTTTAVYGTPTLSFSGVAGLGLQSDGSLYVSPAGTGALQAQATTSSAVGGNARGANAVDWQMYRTSASNVASGSTSFIGSGRDNKATGQDAVVTGGYSNQATTAQAAALSGASNNCGGGQAVIAGGQNGTVGLNFSGILTGYNNNASGYFGTVVGGYANSTTSNSQVTSQAAATTSGSTAVTLSASNASIKVGQIITGTGINFFPPTYVAAISGTSLTLSQNATATNASVTLSFFTPHGVVVGGGNNQATGSYSFIGGGGDAGTAANRNSVAGDWSAIVGGQSNSIVANANYSFIGGGGGNTLSSGSVYASYSVIAGGQGNTGTALNCFIGGGQYNLSSGSYSVISGGKYGTTRGLTGYTVFPANNASLGVNNGLSQAALLVLAKQTTDATATILSSDYNAAGTNNQVILPNNSAYSFRVTIIAGVTGAGNTSSWVLQGAIKRGGTASTTAIVGAVNTTLLAQDSGASTWAVSATADTTNGGLAITVTGQASTTIRWVAKAETCEMTF